MADQSSTSSPNQRSPRPVLQFSLTALFILITVAALVLSTVLGIAQVSGTPTSLLVRRLFGRLITTFPTLAIWIVGLIMAVRRMRTHRKPAIMAAIGFGGLIVATFVMRTTTIALFEGANSGSTGSESLVWAISALAIVAGGISAACWVFILIAIFAGRPADPPRASAVSESLDPFSEDVLASASPVDEDECTDRHEADQSTQG